MSVSTHVLDAVTGTPAAGVPVSLQAGPDWAVLADTRTDADGRVGALAAELASGVYRLVFDTDAYLDGATFYPEVTITFRVTDPQAHYHVPLLLSPFAYSTYRGS